MAVRIVAMRYGGDGVGEDGSGVPFTLTGELVRLPDSSPLEVIAPSFSRTEPKCAHFGMCGGCHYQHADYPAQLEVKRSILEEILGFPAIEVVAAEPWGYRNRIRVRVETAGAMVRVGYSRRASNEFLPVVECPIAAPVLWRTAAAVADASQHFLRRVEEVEIFCSGDEAQVQLSFSLREPAETIRFEQFCSDLNAKVPELIGAGAVLGGAAGRRARKAWSEVSWGAPGLVYQAGGLRYWVSRGAFFQVNRFLVAEMTELVTHGRTGLLAWDLFAGVGLFSKALATKFASVVAVEGSPISARDLQQAGPNVRAVRADTVEFLRRAVLERERPELVVLDPPRAGAGKEACELLGRVGAPEVVYVSCDPVTLGRDLTVLTRVGYEVLRVVMVDMFPQTFHIETVVMLRKQGRSAQV